MRLVLLLISTWAVLITSIARAEQTFPYTARVTADEVYVRSGPGQSYYPTDKLKAGQEVEVYRHDPGGWCAIRPPQGSFSWVSSQYLGAGENDLAIVAADGVAARVGSRFSDIRDVIQVRLHKGEVVQALDREKFSNPSGPQTWYKITPPSGEFRWISSKYVDPDYPKPNLDKGNTSDSPQSEPPAFDEQAQLGSSTPDRTVDMSAYQQNPPGLEREMSPEQYETALEEIDLRIATMVVEEPTVWSFENLRNQTQELLVQAQTALERGRAQKLLSKIDRFSEIKNQNDTLLAQQAQQDQAHQRMGQLLGPVEPQRTTAALTAENRFDGSGQLTRVVSPQVGAPRYALVNNQGNVACYISPAPGVHLSPYLGHQIGVNGSRGYIPEQRAHHVMAQHVQLLETNQVR